MVRILLYVAALIALFAGAIFYGGNAIGAWDPLPPAPTPPPAVKVHPGKAKPDGKAASSTTAQSAVTRKKTPAEKAWVHSANALCRESRDGVQNLVAQATDAGTYSGSVALFEQVRTYNKEMNDRFLALRVPASYRPDVQQIRALFTREEHLFDLMSKALREKRMRAYFSLSDRLTDVALDEADIMANLGAYSCDVDFPSLFGDHV
jgi:hypothetical protein